MFNVQVTQTRPSQSGRFDPAKGNVSFAQVTAGGPDDVPLLTRLVELIERDDERLSELLYTPPGT